MQVAYSRYGCFWKSRVPKKVKCTAFIAMVYNTGLSAGESFVWSKKELQFLDACWTSLLRTAAGNECTNKVFDQGHVKWTTLSTEALQRNWQLVPFAIELRVRRIRRYQKLAQFPVLHKQEIGALFGELCFEPHPTLVNGKVAEHANPWAKQLKADIADLCKYCEDFGDMLQDNIGHLFDCKEEHTDLVADFVLCDPEVLRSAFITEKNKYPPPGIVATPVVDPAAEPTCLDCAEPEQLLRSFRCPVVVNGVRCSDRWKDKRRMLSHIRFSHGLRGIIDAITVTNQCCWCSSSFVTRSAAVAHLKRSIVADRCLVDQSYYCPEVIVPENLTCTLCDFVAADLPQLQRHIRNHSWLRPTFIEFSKVPLVTKTFARAKAVPAVAPVAAPRSVSHVRSSSRASHSQARASSQPRATSCARARSHSRQAQSSQNRNRSGQHAGGRDARARRLHSNAHSQSPATPRLHAQGSLRSDHDGFPRLDQRPDSERCESYWPLVQPTSFRQQGSRARQPASSCHNHDSEVSQRAQTEPGPPGARLREFREVDYSSTRAASDGVFRNPRRDPSVSNLESLHGEGLPAAAQSVSQGDGRQVPPVLSLCVRIGETGAQAGSCPQDSIGETPSNEAGEEKVGPSTPVPCAFPSTPVLSGSALFFEGTPLPATPAWFVQSQPGTPRPSVSVSAGVVENEVVPESSVLSQDQQAMYLAFCDQYKGRYRVLQQECKALAIPAKGNFDTLCRSLAKALSA